MKIKELQEKRGAKAKEARAIITAAEVAKRDLTGEEQSRIQNLHGEIDSLQGQIDVEARQLAIESKRPVHLSDNEERDLNKFNYQGMLRALLNGDALSGVEAEMHAEGLREARSAGVTVGKGITLPRMFVRRVDRSLGIERRDMTATGGTNGDQGGMTIATSKYGLLDGLYDSSVLIGGGATVLEGLQGNLDVSRLIPGTNPAHKTENATSDETSPTTALVSFSPKRLPVFVDIGDQLVMQSSSAIQAVIQNNLGSQLRAVIEAAAINGSGTAPVPRGILNTSGIGAVVGGTNGAAITWAHIVDLESAVADANAAAGSLNYITNTRVRGYTKKTLKASGVAGYIWDNGSLNGYSPLITNACPRTLTKGTSNGVASAIIYGDISQAWFGFWGGLSFEVLRDSSNAPQGLTRLLATTYYDFNVVRPASFAAMTDALTA